MSFMKFCNSACAAVHRSPQQALILASRVMTFIARHSEQTLPPHERRYVARRSEQITRLASRSLA